MTKITKSDCKSPYAPKLFNEIIYGYGLDIEINDILGVIKPHVLCPLDKGVIQIVINSLEKPIVGLYIKGTSFQSDWIDCIVGLKKELKSTDEVIDFDRLMIGGTMSYIYGKVKDELVIIESNYFSGGNDIINLCRLECDHFESLQVFQAYVEKELTNMGIYKTWFPFETMKEIKI